MNLKFTLYSALLIATTFSACKKDAFNENDAINAQKDLLDMKYNHEIKLEELRQKGATALQQLINNAAFAQLKLNDSLTRGSATQQTKLQDSLNSANQKATKRQDYTVVVVDVVTNNPIADADVLVSSEGKVFSGKTNLQGTITFQSLLLFPTTPFFVTKAGYAASQIQVVNLPFGKVQLWNTADAKNEIAGKLFVETDLTNFGSEVVGKDVLVTASVNIPNGNFGSYTIYFPAYTTSTGTYSIKVPDAPNPYVLAFAPISADQKLFINSSEDDVKRQFPYSLPRIVTVKTLFDVNNVTSVPEVTQQYYFKVAPDNSGAILYLPGNNYYYNNSNYYNQVFMSNIGGGYQIERLNVGSYWNYYPSNGIDLNSFKFNANTTVDVEMVDVAGTLIKNAPKLIANTDANGTITYSYSPENGSGYIHLKRNAPVGSETYGTLVDGAKGILYRANNLYYNYNIYDLNFGSNLNVFNNTMNSQAFFIKGGEKIVRNFYYGTGQSRDKQVN